MSDFAGAASEAARAKEALRRAALARRAALSPEARIEAAMTLAERADTLALSPGVTVAGFWPIRDEIDPRPLMAALRDRGHRLCLPIVEPERLVFRELLPGGDLVPAGFGTAGPGPEAATVEPDVLLVPLAAFDTTGHRIGYGKGHYDRTIAFIETMRPLRLIGVAFSVQEVPAVPSEPHDMRLDAVLTEAGLVDCHGRG